jgi:NitT/TauT family transport system permease protein
MKRSTEYISHAIFFIVLLAAWETSIRALGVSPLIIPSPGALATHVIDDVASGILWVHGTSTLIEVVAGFFGAILVALALGTAIVLIPFAERLVYPYILALQTIPKIAVAPLFLIWFGYGVQTKAITAGLVAFLPILINVIAGLKTVDQRRLLMMRSIHANPFKTFLRLRFPSMLPYFFAGLESGVILAVLGAVVGEFIGGSKGLGSLILQRQAAIDVAGVFSAIFFLSVMGLFLSLAIRLVKRRFAFW